MAYKEKCLRIRKEKFPRMEEQYRYIMHGISEDKFEIATPELLELNLTWDDVDLVWDVTDKLFTNIEKDGYLDNEYVIGIINKIYNDQFLIDLRVERDKLIAETDWWASTDLTMTDAQLKYRQDLRDITLYYSSLLEVEWPIKP